MALTAGELNRATLARQLLLEREQLDAPAGVRRVGALQAQEPASPYIALWNRLEGFDGAGLDTALAAGEIVKATLMRITLHAVHRDDYPAFHVAMQSTLRGSCLNDERFTRTGLDAAGADALVPGLLAFLSEPRTNTQIESFLGSKGAWWALRRFAPTHHAVSGGPWSFGPRPAYVAATPPELDPQAAVAQLIRRYLESFGPASAQDFRMFAMFRGARQALAGMDDLQRLQGPDGTQLYDVPGGAMPGANVPAPPRLLGMWDSALLAYADRSRIIPEAHRRQVMRVNGDVLPTLLVDGYVAGVWRPVENGIEATAFGSLPDAAWAGLDAEAGRLVAFLAGRDPAVYRRFGHWWEKLPAGETRLLGVH